MWSPGYYIGMLGEMSKQVFEEYINKQHTEKSNAGRPSKKKGGWLHLGNELPSFRLGYRDVGARIRSKNYTPQNLLKDISQQKNAESFRLDVSF